MEAGKKRGIPLTIIFIFLLVAYLGVGSFYFLIFLTPCIINFCYSTAGLAFTSIAAFASAMSVFFLFRWKRWAFFALWLIALAHFFLNIQPYGLGIGVGLVGFLGPVLSLALIPKWKLFV